MPRTGRAAAEAAREMIGVPFRLQGRDGEQGLDCVGLAARALDVGTERVRRDYALRGTRLQALEAELAALGLARVAGAAEAGDVMIFSPGAAQLHLAIFTGDGFVHADAGLGRVVERPGEAPWPLLGAWRPGTGKE